MSSIIILDSSDDESEQAPKKSSDMNPTSHPVPSVHSNGIPGESVKRKSDNEEVIKQVKRIKPTLITSTIDPLKYVETSMATSFGNGDEASPPKANENDEDYSTMSKNVEQDNPDTSGITEDEQSKDFSEENTITPSFSTLLDACKAADSSDDMKTLIETKLLKYYHSVHPDFVTSKGFLKTVNTVSEAIKSNPELVYYQLKTVVEELKIRRKTKAAVMSNEEITSTGNERRDRQIRLLSRGLLSVTRRIAKLEESEVDLGDENNSTFLQVERLKKHACNLYEKICDLTGESKHAHRAVKKPISFAGTSFPQFNRTLQSFINRTNTFPDFFDVLRCLEHCNVQYGFGLRNDEMKKIAQEAFLKVGKSLQTRRKADLYETATHFTGTNPDPALDDESLNSKLTENQKFHAKIGTLIDKYAKEQEMASSDTKDSKKSEEQNVDNLLSPKSTVNTNGVATIEEAIVTEKDEDATVIVNIAKQTIIEETNKEADEAIEVIEANKSEKPTVEAIVISDEDEF